MTTIPIFDRITVEPAKCGGKPCIRGMRITVRRVLEILATHRDRDELFRQYPFLEEADLIQALQYAAASVDGDLCSQDLLDTVTLELLATWREQDATSDPNEIATANRELADFQKNMNDNRSASGESLIYS